jgi:hypothetical protein
MAIMTRVKARLPAIQTALVKAGVELIGLVGVQLQANKVDQRIITR